MSFWQLQDSSFACVYLQVVFVGKPQDSRDWTADPREDGRRTHNWCSDPNHWPANFEHHCRTANSAFYWKSCYIIVSYTFITLEVESQVERNASWDAAHRCSGCLRHIFTRGIWISLYSRLQVEHQRGVLQSERITADRVVDRLSRRESGSTPVQVHRGGAVTVGVNVMRRRRGRDQTITDGCRTKTSRVTWPSLRWHHVCLDVEVNENSQTHPGVLMVWSAWYPSPSALYANTLTWYFFLGSARDGERHSTAHVWDQYYVLCV